MDFEEQLEKAERLTSPSLVGSSMRSADDSAHQNYIHPEKYKGLTRARPSKGFAGSSIGASLDDLISEGALLGSEEDFERFLDDTGNVRSNAKYAANDAGQSSLRHVQDAHDVPDDAVLSPVSSTAEPDSKVGAPPPQTPQSADDSLAVPSVAVSGGEPSSDASAGLYSADNYSAPNLSEYQIGHQIEDHSQLLDLVKSYDLSRLPSSTDRERSKTSDYYHPATERVPPARTAARSNAPSASKLDFGDNVKVVENDSLHAPYFQRDARLPSRSRSAPRTDRLRSRSLSSRPHLARGDSYKNTHPEMPSKYELPADMRFDEEEEDTRRSRQARPTMGDSIAAAEAEEARQYHGESITRDPSLVTTGDYTNYNADAPAKSLDVGSLYSTRLQLSTNYLRSISRSRSRQPHHVINEKNDANPEELAKEGALVSDDPYDQVGDLDNLMKHVLRKPHGDQRKAPRNVHASSDAAAFPSSPTRSAPVNEEVSSKKLVNDVSAEEKETETHEQLMAEAAPTVTASDISVPDGEHATDVDGKVKEAGTKEGDATEVDNKVEEAGTKEEDAEHSEEEYVKEYENSVAQERKEDEEGAKELEAELDEKSHKSYPLDEEVKSEEQIDLPAEEKVKEAHEQLVAEEAPIVTAADINLKGFGKSEEPATEATEAREETETDVVSPEHTKTAIAESLSSVPDVADVLLDPQGVEKETTKNSDKLDTGSAKELKPAASAAAEAPETAETVESTEAAESTETTETTEATEATETTKVTETAESTEATKTTDATEAAEAAVAVESTESAETTETAETAATAATAEALEATEVSEVTEVTGAEAATASEQDVSKTEAVPDKITKGLDRSGEHEEKEVLDEQTTTSETEVSTPSASGTAGEDTPASDTQVEAPVDSAVSDPVEEAKGSEPKELEVPALKNTDAKVKDVPVTEDDDDFDVSPEELRKHLESLPVYVFTSLAGGMQIVNRTNRLLTILKANGVKFEYRDLGTDEEAKKLWRRYAQGKTLPGIVRGDDFIGNWEYIEEVNEDYRLREVLFETL